MHTEKTLRQLLGRYYIALQVCLVIALLLVARYFAIMYGLDSITLTSLSSSIISGAIFVVGFLLVGVFSDYKEADKLPAEIRSILESIIAEGDTLLRKDATFDADNQALKETVVRFIDEFEQGLSHDKNHSHIEHAMDEIKKFDVVFDSMEKRGVPPNYMTRIKTEQSNLKKILLRIYHIQKTKFIPSAVFLVDSIVATVIALLVFLKTDPLIGYIGLGIISYILLYVRGLIILLEKPFRKGRDDTHDDVSIFTLRELRDSLVGKM